MISLLAETTGRNRTREAVYRGTVRMSSAGLVAYLLSMQLTLMADIPEIYVLLLVCAVPRMHISTAGQQGFVGGGRNWWRSCRQIRGSVW